MFTLNEVEIAWVLGVNSFVIRFYSLALLDFIAGEGKLTNSD